MAEAVERTEEEKRQRRRRLTLLLVPIVAFQVAGIVTNLAAPALINDHPLIVIFFNPINRYLIVASNSVATWEFYAVGFFRLIITDPLYFMLGRWFGHGALDWIEEKTGGTGMVPFIKKWFGKAGPVFVLVMPNTYISVLAGASGMKVRTFFALNIVGTLGRLVLIDLTGDFLEPVLDPILDFVKRYQWQLVAFSVAMFVLQTSINQRKGKTSTLESVGAMADELEASIEASESGLQPEERVEPDR